MKKIITICILLSCFVGGCIWGCISNRDIDINQTKARKHLEFVYVQVVEIYGHLYIIVDNKRHKSGGGVSVIHAEHCPCKNKLQ